MIWKQMGYSDSYEFYARDIKVNIGKIVLMILDPLTSSYPQNNQTAPQSHQGTAILQIQLTD